MDKREKHTILGLFLLAGVLMVGLYYISLWSIIDEKKEQASCAADPFKEKRIDGVVRVFMHRTGDYSVMTEIPNTTEVKVVEIHCRQTRVVRDAPTDSPMWVDEAPSKEYPCQCGTAIIHIHSVQEVNGGGWERHFDKGQVERGTTEVVE